MPLSHFLLIGFITNDPAFNFFYLWFGLSKQTVKILVFIWILLGIHVCSHFLYSKSLGKKFKIPGYILQPDSIRVMGDKSTARDTMKKAGVPTVPGSQGLLQVWCVTRGAILLYILVKKIDHFFVSFGQFFIKKILVITEHGRSNQACPWDWISCYDQGKWSCLRICLIIVIKHCAFCGCQNCNAHPFYLFQTNLRAIGILTCSLLEYICFHFMWLLMSNHNDNYRAHTHHVISVCIMNLI